MTPLVDREWGHAVLVNRGWVPAEWKSDAQLRASGSPAGKVNFRAPTALAIFEGKLPALSLMSIIHEIEEAANSSRV